ncbi:MAG: hypothetical protein ACYSUZ_06125, partial [Planctomycetota bacterium]
EMACSFRLVIAPLALVPGHSDIMFGRHMLFEIACSFRLVIAPLALVPCRFSVINTHCDIPIRIFA